MSFIDELYKEETGSKKSEGSLTSDDDQVIKKIIESAKAVIRRNKDSRQAEGYVYGISSIDNGETHIRIGIDSMSKKKYKRYTIDELEENRVPYQGKMDRLEKNITAVVLFNSEYFFRDYSEQFLSALKEELMNLGLKSAELTIEDVPMEYVALKPTIWLKGIYRATYYNNNKKSKALKLRLEW